MKEQKIDWNIFDVIVSVSILILLFILYVAILPVLPKHENLHQSITVISYLVAILYLYNKYKYGLLAKITYIKPIIIGIFTCILFAIPYLNWLSNNAIPKQYDILQNLSAVNKLLYLLIFCIIIPAEEEILFRGLYYRILKNKYDIFTATIVSVALFTLNHAFQGIDLISIALQGLIYTYVYEKSKSVWSSIFVHSFNNSFWFLITYLSVK